MSERRCGGYGVLACWDCCLLELENGRKRRGERREELAKAKKQTDKRIEENRLSMGKNEIIISI